MAPEYGSTCGIFPIDEETIRYLELSGRSKERIDLVEAYAKAPGHVAQPGRRSRRVHRRGRARSRNRGAVASPARAARRIACRCDGENRLRDERQENGRGARRQDSQGEGSRRPTVDGKTFEVKDGAVLIAAITSCTNTSNPSSCSAPGCSPARRAKGLKSKPWVKTSLAPGSRVVTDYFKRPGC
jgi:aconitate hydratase